MQEEHARCFLMLLAVSRLREPRVSVKQTLRASKLKVRRLIPQSWCSTLINGMSSCKKTSYKHQATPNNSEYLERYIYVRFLPSALRYSLAMECYKQCVYTQNVSDNLAQQDASNLKFTKIQGLSTCAHRSAVKRLTLGAPDVSSE